MISPAKLMVFVVRIEHALRDESHARVLEEVARLRAATESAMRKEAEKR